MLKIRPEQMEVLERYSNQQFEERVRNFLRFRFGNVCQTTLNELEQFVHKQIEKARSYQFITERQVVTYVTAAWLKGERFDTEFSDVQQILTSVKYSTEEKLEWLSQWIDGNYKIKMKM